LDFQRVFDPLALVSPQQDFQFSGRFDIHQDASEEVKPTQKNNKK